MQDRAAPLHTLPMSRDDFIAGIDVGGTKVHIMDTLSTNLHRYMTGAFPDLYGVLD